MENEEIEKNNELGSNKSEETESTEEDDEENEDEDNEEGIEEAERKREEDQEVRRKTIFLSPEGVIMMLLAVLVDGGELLLELIPVAGQILSIIVDIFAFIFFGLWMMSRSKKITVPKRTGAKIAKISKAQKNLKWLRPLCFIIEALPIVSSVLPLWILVVYLELKHNS